MEYLEVNRICENIVEKIFKKLPLLKLKIKEEIEQTDSGALRTIEIKFENK